MGAAQDKPCRVTGADPAFRLSGQRYIPRVMAEVIRVVSASNGYGINGITTRLVPEAITATDVGVR